MNKDFKTNLELRNKCVGFASLLGKYNTLGDNLGTDFTVSKYLDIERELLKKVILDNLSEFEGDVTVSSREDIIELMEEDTRLDSVVHKIPTENWLMTQRAVLRLAMLVTSDVADELKGKIWEEYKVSELFEDEGGFPKVFEGQEVDIIENDGGVLFELYSTGMALGYVKYKTVKNKTYSEIRKDRIDKIIENVGISTFPHCGGKYLSEEQLYDFMLEARTEKCKKFRKWVTSEVLPSIRKHGAYMTESTIEKSVTNPDFLIELAETLRSEQEKTRMANLRNMKLISDIERSRKELSLKQTEIDNVICDDDLLPISTLGTILSTYDKELGYAKIFEYLRSKKILKDGWYYVDGEKKVNNDIHNLPYAQYSQYFSVKFRPCKLYKKNKNVLKTYLNAEGIKYVLSKLVKDGRLTQKDKELAEKEAFDKLK